jgi:thiol-disulfide isomerase/thioredoxin
VRAARLALALALASTACASSSREGIEGLPSGPVALRLVGTDGEPFNLASLRGEPVLVAVFATWSDPALVELRLFEEMKTRYPQLQVVCAVVEQDLRMVQIFEETFTLPFVVGMVQDPVAFTGARGPFGPITISPTSVLLDRQGRIAARMDGMWPPKLLPEAIERVLDAP